MRLEVISEPQRRIEFAPEWADLVEQHSSATPFQHPDWLTTWWRHFGSGKLRVFVFRDQNRCVAVVPCFLHEWNGARQLTLLGSGISDYLDPIIEADCECHVTKVLGEYLLASGEWDLCDWQDLSNNTPLTALSRALNMRIRSEVPCSDVQLPRDFYTFWEQRPRHLRRNVRRYGDKAREHGDLQFRVSTEARPELLDSLVRLHTARWNNQGEPGMIEANHSADFLRDVAVKYASTGMLRIFTLHYKAGIAAIIVGFVYRGKLFGYLTGSDPNCRQFSVASVLLYEAIRYCCTDGVQAWNFCRGNEGYKADWGAETISRCRLVIQRSDS